MNYKFSSEKVKSLRDIAYDAIKDAILSGNIVAGEKLIEADIANQLGFSRGPIREALRQLETEGLVYSQPYKGTIVAEIRSDETDLVYIPIRRIIETYACLTAASIFDDSDYEYLYDCIHKIEEYCAAEDLKGLTQYDSNFHRYIVSRCTSNTLTTLWESLSIHFYEYIYYQNRLKRHTKEMFAKVPKEHYDLIDAMKSGDKQRIEEEVIRHIYTSKQ